MTEVPTKRKESRTEHKTKGDLMNDIADVVDGVEPREYEHSEYFTKGDLRAIAEWIAQHQEGGQQ